MFRAPLLPLGDPGLCHLRAGQHSFQRLYDLLREKHRRRYGRGRQIPGDHLPDLIVPELFSRNAGRPVPSDPDGTRFDGPVRHRGDLRHFLHPGNRLLCDHHDPSRRRDRQLLHADRLLRAEAVSAGTVRAVQLRDGDRRLPELGVRLNGRRRDAGPDRAPYHYVWYAGALFSFLGIAFLWVVYRKYLELGGDSAYQAPAVQAVES